MVALPHWGFSSPTKKSCAQVLNFLEAPIASRSFGRHHLNLYSYSPVNFNPFSAPQVFKIWPSDSAKLAKWGFDDEQVRISHDPSYDQGKAFLVFDGDPKSQNIVAISGYVPINRAKKRICLRWHGVVPTLQGHGISKWILEIVVARLKSKYPSATTLVEHIPDLPSREKSKNFFLHMGFIPKDKIHRYPWSPHPWRELELNLE